jgi:hypothetical protein
MDEKRVTQESSLDSAIEYAKRFGASVDQAKRIHDLVSRNKTPEIQFFEVKYGPDSDDRLAVWITLVVGKDYPQTPQKISNLSRTATAIRAELLKENMGVWPYVVVRSST